MSNIQSTLFFHLIFCVYIEDDEGRNHRLMHLATVDVSEGDRVNTRDLIGTSDDTGRSHGPHLHYDLTDGNDRIDPEEEFDCDD